MLPDSAVKDYKESGVLRYDREDCTLGTRITTGFPAISKHVKTPHDGLNVALSEWKIKELNKTGWAQKNIIV